MAPLVNSSLFSFVRGTNTSLNGMTVVMSVTGGAATLRKAGSLLPSLHRGHFKETQMLLSVARLMPKTSVKSNCTKHWEGRIDTKSHKFG